jgi:hypothetical protein
MVKFTDSHKELLKDSNVKLILLKHTGEEILAYVLQSGDKKADHYYLFSPVKLTNIVNPLTGGVQYLMSEWISQRITSDEGFEVAMSDVLVVADVEPHMIKAYTQFAERVDEYKSRVQEHEMDLEITESDETMSESDPEDVTMHEGDMGDDEMWLDLMSRTHTPAKKTVH